MFSLQLIGSEYMDTRACADLWHSYVANPQRRLKIAEPPLLVPPEEKELALSIRFIAQSSNLSAATV